MSKLLQNAVWISEANLYLVSTDPEVKVAHTFEDGKTLWISGGLEYAQRGGDNEVVEGDSRYQEWILTDEDDMNQVYDRILLRDPSTGLWSLITSMPCHVLTEVIRESWPLEPLQALMVDLIRNVCAGGCADEMV